MQIGEGILVGFERHVFDGFANIEWGMGKKRDENVSLL